MRNKLLILLITLIIGVGSGVAGWQKIQNFNSPLIFMGIVIIPFAIIALVVLKTKKHLYDFENLSDDELPTIQVSIFMGIIGVGMLITSYLNIFISRKELCDNFKIVNYEYSKGGFRRPGISKINFDINKDLKEIDLNKSEFDYYIEEDSIPICYYSSPIGFDYVELN